MEEMLASVCPNLLFNGINAFSSVMATRRTSIILTKMRGLNDSIDPLRFLGWSPKYSVIAENLVSLVSYPTIEIGR